MQRFISRPRVGAGPWSLVLLVAALVAACSSAVTAPVEPLARSWRQAPLTALAGARFPPGYMDCSATGAPTGMRVLVCRPVQADAAETQAALQLLVTGVDSQPDADTLIIKGPTFGDAYSVRTAVFQSDEGTDATVLIAEGVTEYPLGAEVLFVDPKSLQRVGSMDVVGVDEEGDPTSVLPLLRLTGPRESLQIIVTGKAARMRPDGSYEEPPAGRQFCSRIVSGQWVIGTAGPGTACEETG